jgi:magnesium transporter
MLKKTALKTPITRHMRTDCTRLHLGQTVGQTLDALRRDPPGERIVYFYVVDDAGRLQGVVPTRKLLLSEPGVHIDDIMGRRVLTLPASATVQAACELFAIHHFLAFPVVDAERRLLGVVDIELYTDELDQLNDAEKLNELFQAIGVYAGEAAASSPLRAFLQRFPWLGCNLAGGLICAVLANVYQAELSRVVALALFIPVVLNLAESVSSQSVTLTLHLLRNQTPDWRRIAQSLWREVSTGLLLGSACGLVVGMAAWAWLGTLRVALCLLGGIAGGVAVSAALGLTLPVTLRLLKLDPKVAAGPIALASADVTTLFAYLSLARGLLA